MPRDVTELPNVLSAFGSLHALAPWSGWVVPTWRGVLGFLDKFINARLGNREQLLHLFLEVRELRTLIE